MLWPHLQIYFFFDYNFLLLNGSMSPPPMSTGGRLRWLGDRACLIFFFSAAGLGRKSVIIASPELDVRLD